MSVETIKFTSASLDEDKMSHWLLCLKDHISRLVDGALKLSDHFINEFFGGLIPKVRVIKEVIERLDMLLKHHIHKAVL